ncbi:UNVERIFIED_CONTAM: Transposon Tf2-12 polyprotein [Sesamum radiatum]|uniref:Transposon Tf2-12 polyprotein n=1 Tax=Sesamum radiatum TaxID=300843 RepID=A0AAW2JXQ8_SESRA
MQAREYPFLDSDVPGIFDDLLEANLIDLPEMKRPEEAERKDDPKYCKYHRLVGHAIQDCFVFKDKVMQLARQGKISLEEDSPTTNVITIESKHVNGNKDSCNATHGDNITSNEDTLFGKEDSSDTDDCMSTITFTDEDLLLGSKPHNRPLFVDGYELEIPIDELSNSRLMIQGFNQGGQRAVGIIRMQLTMEDMVSSALFHVIDAKTSYNMLLGRPWLHEIAVVPSTWHQCFKYCRNGIVKKVLGDNKPFTEAESHFADAKYYIEDANKRKEILPPEEPKSCNNQNARKNESSTLEPESLKSLTLPLTQIIMKQPSKPPLKGFVPSTQEEEGGHEALAIDEKGFDPKAFKLLIKAGYDPKEKLYLGKLPPKATDKKLHGLNATQIMLKEKGHAIQDSRVGLGFTPPKPVRITIKRVNNGEVEEEDAEDAPAKLEEGIKATIDELKEVNLGDIENPRPIYISASLTHGEEGTYIALLHEFKDVFAWSYKEMPGLDPKVAVHHLSVKKGARPVKQGQRRFRPELIPLIEGEVNKLIEVGFIREVKYPMWISSIVPVRKKNGQIRVCVDFRDLNNACPKDDFPLPIAELMIDATTGHEALSFMDGSSGYNQIRMAPTDEELTAFRTPKGIYCYKVMPFGLKNIGATYQRAMQKIFDDMLHKNVECYVDDLVVKSKKRENHFHDLRKVFERLRRYQLKMNPSKCAFGVTSGKFLGFIVRQRGIEIEQAKIDAILECQNRETSTSLKVYKES